ncbi:MAG: sulfatase [bacterium]
MSNDRIKGFIHSQFHTFYAGALAGMDAGIIEVLIISGFGSKPANLSGFLFAVLAYGLLGGALGKMLNVTLRIIPMHSEKKNSKRELGAFIYAATFAFILFLIFFFRAFRDFHAERVRYVEPTGLLTIAILGVAALVIFFVLRLLLAKSLKGALGFFTNPAGFTVTTVVVIVIGLVLNVFLADDTEMVKTHFSPDQQAEIAEKPSVLLIMVDTLRPDHLGCLGQDKAAATPNIDALARDAVLFKTMYAQATHTKPSTAALLTSRYPTEHRAIHKTDALPPSVTTAAEIFADAGYYCGGIVTNINLAPVYNFQQGFHEYTYLPPKFLFGANEAASRLVIYGVMRLAWMKISDNKVVYHFYRSGETVNGYVNDFFDRNKDKSFFFFLHYMDPHDPFFEHPYSGKGYARASMPNPDPKFVEPFEDFYRQEIEYLDQWIGELVKRLKSEGLYDKTVIVFTSDHGEEFYEHGGWWHGATLHEEQVRVPLLIKKQNSLDAELISESLTMSIDVVPTLLGLTDLDIPAKMRGRDLFGPPPSEDFIPEVFSEADHEGNVVQILRIGPWKYIQTNPDNPRGRPPEQLFYVPDDPWEKNNLVNAETDKVEELKLLLRAKYQDLMSTAEQGSTQEMDQATQERLRALGYTQ